MPLGNCLAVGVCDPPGAAIVKYMDATAYEFGIETNGRPSIAKHRPDHGTSHYATAKDLM